MDKNWTVYLNCHATEIKGVTRHEARELCEKYLFDTLSHNGEDLSDPYSQLHIRLRELNIEFGKGEGWFGSGESEDRDGNPVYTVEAFRED